MTVYQTTLKPWRTVSDPHVSILAVSTLHFSRDRHHPLYVLSWLSKKRLYQEIANFFLDLDLVLGESPPMINLCRLHPPASALFSLSCAHVTFDARSIFRSHFLSSLVVKWRTPWRDALFSSFGP